MNSSQLCGVFQKYDNRLANASIPAAPTNTKRVTTNRGIRLGHIRWMCQEMMTKLAEAEDEAGLSNGNVSHSLLEKANRWLGFVQATLWIDGFYTIDEMKADNKA